MRRTTIGSFGLFLLASISVLADETPTKLPRPSSWQSWEFRLDGPRVAEERFYESATVMTKVFTDGKKQPAGAIRLYVQATPGEKQKDGKTAFKYWCRRLEIERADGQNVTVPELEKFTYQIEPGVDAKKQVMGIEHARFLKLKDSSGKDLTFVEPYFVYNTFIDFHAFNDVMASVGLRRLGDSVAVGGGQQLPVHLGDTIQEGSVYRLGESRVRLDGIGLVNKKPTAVLSFDSGDSSFLMKLAIQPDAMFEVQGYSRFEGSVQVDLASNWPALCHWKEIVISETKKDGKVLPGGDQTMVRVARLPRWRRRISTSRSRRPLRNRKNTSPAGTTCALNYKVTAIAFVDRLANRAFFICSRRSTP